ncbi:MAG: cell division FtsA domain-containing protein [Oscillospiraceae bacterium]
MNMQENENVKENSVFALDIGTRSVIGVVGYSENDIFHIEAIEAMEHPKRAMLDGQIEDINAVAAVANIVKMALEDRIGRKLTKVCVAAAGRALRTVNASFEVELPAGGPATEETVYALEMGAVSKAADEIKATEQGDALFCVGHSVARFLIDDYPYSTIIDHKGKTAKAEVIATFLPAEVVNSLEAAMKKIGVSIEFLTLEPIAAMNAVIPPELRLLNLALVDIGAGTSDIAVCDGGSVAAYTMATVAGDEITEALIKEYLVDFQTAEKMKFEISKETAVIKYRDILGFDYEVPLAEVLSALAPALNSLSDIISERILEVNGKAPSAVFLVGGGGKTPQLCRLVAERLSLDERKVAIGGNNFMKKLAVGVEDTFGPEYATPIGIALTAISTGEYKGFDVFINGEKRRLLRTGTLAMMDVLLLCGYSYSDVMGKSGQNLNFEVNGEKRVLRGGMLKPAVIALNGRQVGISVQVVSGDSIHIIPATTGENASLKMNDIVHDYNKFTVSFCGNLLSVGNFVSINGDAQDADKYVQDGDKLEIVRVETLADLCAFANADMDAIYEINYTYAPQSTLLNSGDIIIIKDFSTDENANSESIGTEKQETEYADSYISAQFSEKQQYVEPVPPQEINASDALAFEPSESEEDARQAEDDIDRYILQNTDYALPPDIAQLLGIELPNNADEYDAHTQSEETAPPQQYANINAESDYGFDKDKEQEQAYGFDNDKEQAYGFDKDKEQAYGSDKENGKEQAFGFAETDADVQTLVSNWQPPKPMYSPEPLLASEADFSPVPITLNGSQTVLPARDGGVPYLFLDMLTLVNIDPSKPEGDIELILNGHDASFLEKISAGDDIHIGWKRR